MANNQDELDNCSLTTVATVGQGAKGGIQQTTQRLIGVPPNWRFWKETCNEVTGEQPIEIHRDDFWIIHKNCFVSALISNSIMLGGWIRKNKIYSPKEMTSW